VHQPHHRPRRLAWPRTSPFHGGNTGSNPVGDAKLINNLRTCWFWRTPAYATIKLLDHSTMGLAPSLPTLAAVHGQDSGSHHGGTCAALDQSRSAQSDAQKKLPAYYECGPDHHLRQATLWISGEWKPASRKSRRCLLRIMVSWIVVRADVFKPKRSNRRHLRYVLTGFRPVEMRRIAGQNDNASGRICLQLFRIELLA
jgi:hypothetical protein